MRKRYKYGLILLVLLLVDCSLLSLSLIAGIIILILELLLALFVVMGLILNKLIMRTNWYKNVFIYSDQMCSNLGYRTYLIRNLDVINVGSFPARFAFHYDGILGENWSTGNQGLDMDFEILKFRHSFLKKGGVVLIPLVPFSSVSGYLRNKPEYCGLKYYAKFAKTLDPMQVSLIPPVKDAIKWIRQPLLYEPKAIKYLLFDEQPDNRLSVSELSLMRPQLLEDARKMVESWLVEFGMKSLDEPLSESLREGMNLSIKTMQDMIDFLLERELKPVLVYTPMSEPLQNYFTDGVKQKLVYDFIDRIGRPTVTFLDYSNDNKWKDPCLYINSLFLNLKGRKQFTNQVLKDLKLI